jgi:hypothetical protein
VNPRAGGGYQLGSRYSGSPSQLVSYRRAEALLYLNEESAALDVMTRAWAKMERSNPRHGSWLQSLARLARVRCTLAVQRRSPDRVASDSIKKDLRALRDSRSFSGYPDALEACSLHRQGDRDGARSLVSAALARFERDRMNGCASCARRRLGELTRGAAGARLLARADSELKTRVSNPKRWTAMHLGAL